MAGDSIRGNVKDPTIVDTEWLQQVWLLFYSVSTKATNKPLKRKLFVWVKARGITEFFVSLYFEN